MLLNNKIKNTIREKFNINQGKEQKTIESKREKREKIKNKNTSDEIDDIYTIEHIDKENTSDDNNDDYIQEAGLILPIEREISKELPNSDYITATNYTKEIKDYIYDIRLEKGYPSITGNDIIKIVIYQINNFNTLPFLTYLLYKSNKKEDDSELISLLEIKIDKSDAESIKNKTKNIVRDIIFKDYTTKPKYKGYREYKNNKYLFFEHSPKKEALATMIIRDTNWIWCLVDELINKKNVLTFPIKNSTIDFFLHNLDISTIYRKDNISSFETPVVGYYGNHYKKINFISVFGIPRSSVFASLGPFYYFASYDLAVNYAMFPSHKKIPEFIDEEQIFNKENKYTKGGLVRFAVFMGKSKFFDETIIEKYDALNKDWYQSYNSAFIQENKGKGLKFGVKQYLQQIPLSYHIINTSTNETDFEKIKIE